MFIDVEIVESTDRGFDDVRCRRRPKWDTSSVGSPVVQERKFGLGAGKAPIIDHPRKFGIGQPRHLVEINDEMTATERRYIGAPW